MIYRALTDTIQSFIQKFPVLVITGPRQSGKTTLVKSLFPEYTYINFEELDVREFAQTDPRGFLNQYKSQLILDEAQYVPNLFSYIQAYVDNTGKMGEFILTGSKNFLLLEKISQSLAGRVALFTLLPFSYAELKNTQFNYENYEDYLLKGFYPPIYSRNLEASEWFPSYLNTYLERDVRQIVNVGNLMQFRSFLQLCAGSVGQTVNFSAIGNSIGISNNTAKHWLSVLEASYIIYLLPTYYNNFKKRIVKSPKLYFYDTGLASQLLGIKNIAELQSHFAKGALFENYVIMELLKTIINQRLNLNLYYWRDSNANEVDCIIDHGTKLIPLEIKSAQTINPSFFKGLDFFDKINPSNRKILVYGGNECQMRTNYEIINWNNLDKIFIQKS